jgi:uracil-DNA glycosylase
VFSRAGPPDEYGARRQADPADECSAGLQADAADECSVRRQADLLMDPHQLKEHLTFAAELGVAGISKDPVWRARADEQLAAGEKPSVSPSASSAEPAQTTSDEGRLEAGPVSNAAPDAAPLTFARNAAAALVAVRADLGDCTRCKLHTQGRRQIVFGVGNPDADLMFVGEAPGADEDVQGIPFVGRAGQLLTKIIEAIDLKREDVYIANVIKCRPPGNRNPEQDEVETCEPFLFQQIDVIKPKVIVALGTFAARALLRTLDPISRLRGRVFEYRGSKLIPTFHPAYLLRNPSSKREVWEDMKLVRSLLKSES